MSLARMCWMHKFGILLTWAVLTAATAAVIYRLPAIYTAEALILIDAQKIPERLVPSTVSADTEDRLASLSQEILSNTRLKKIIESNDLYRKERMRNPLDEVVQMMRKDIWVKLERGWAGNKPDAFRVGYQGKEPAVVAQVANQIANLFIEENLRARAGQAEGTSEFLSTQVAEAKKKLDSLETAVREYKSRFNGELPEQAGALQGGMNRLQLEQASNRDAIARAEESKATLENTLRMAQETLDMITRPRTVPSEAPSPRTTAAMDLPAAAAPAPPKQSEILEGQLDVLLGRYGEQHPEVKRLKSEIAKMKAIEARTPSTAAAAAVVARVSPTDTPAQALARAVTVSPFDTGQARERVQVLRSQIVLVQKEIDSRKADQQRVARDISELQAKLTSVPLREQELMQITRDYEITKLNYHSLLEKQLSAEMSTDMERRQKSERFTVIDPAHVPERPSKPNRLFYGTVAAMFFFCMAVTGALGLELRKDNLLGEWELPQSVPVLARVPQISMSGQGGFWPWTRWSKPIRIAVSSVALVSVVSVVALVAAQLYFHRGF
jgi:polysaccharide chain length determinant protein (PEP-CTERM system associated)